MGKSGRMPIPRTRLRLRGALEFGDVELFHLHHGLHRFRVLDEVGEPCGYDLPGEAELVLEPAALAFAAAVGGEPGPVFVYLLLRVAADGERDGLGELEVWATVECCKFLSIEFEGDGENAARWAWRVVGMT